MKTTQPRHTYVLTDIHKHKTTIWAGRKIPPGYAEALAMESLSIDFEHSKCICYLSIDNKITRSEALWDKTNSNQLTLNLKETL